MWKIVKLDDTLINQIAAWEVVERPISVVKELVENSIDAWATNIKIKILEWWIKNIEIIDDWFWINKDDLLIITEKHTTSKIKNINDLHSVLTFWFRWEAISSISSVSNFEIISRVKNNDFWYSKIVKNNKSLEIQKKASEIWTKIIVQDLFINVPARLNYLKKPRTEYSHILSFLQQIGLSYPKIWFEFISENKQIFKYSSNSNLKTRIYEIYWVDFSEHLLKIDFELQWIKIKWYISDPKISFSNKNKQSLFINNRVIKSYMITKAISDWYNRFIPHNMSPAYVLNIEIDPTQVDVNVHPKKLEVRFASEQNIFKLVYHSIQEKLESVTLIKNENINKSNFNSKQFNNVDNNVSKWYSWSWTKFKSYSPYTDKSNSLNQKELHHSINFTKSILNNKEDLNVSMNNDLHITKLWKIIWQSHNSYIIVETKNAIQFLDQHALAERVIYEKLLKNDYGHNRQFLLISENINLLPKQIDIVKENIDLFNKMWFDLEIMKQNNIIVNTIPDFIKKENIESVFIKIITDIWNYNFSKSISLEEIKNKIFAFTACRSAIKFWNKLSIFEINKLLNDSVIDYSSTCPHWRPVIFEINLNELKNKYER